MIGYIQSSQPGWDDWLHPIIPPARAVNLDRVFLGCGEEKMCYYALFLSFEEKSSLIFLDRVFLGCGEEKM